MKKKEYEVPLTTYSEVELEGTFCASIVDEDKQDNSNISIESQEIGATSDYFTNDSDWDY